jgi:hypothetical protein
MRTTIRLDDDLLRETKIYAAATDRTLTRLIEDALREALARRQRVQKRRRLRLPTSGGCGLQPGVDLSDSKALWDLMDGIEGSTLIPRPLRPSTVANGSPATAILPASRACAGVFR